MLKKIFSFAATMIGLLIIGAGAASAQSPDFQSTISGNIDPAEPESVVTYTTTVANVGDANTSNEIILDIYLPLGVPCDLNAYLDGDSDAQTAFDTLQNSIQISNNIWIDESSPGAGDGTGTFFGVDGFCEHFLLQPQNINLLSGDEAGAVLFDAVMPTPPLTEGAVHISSAGLDQDLNFGRGGCDDGGDCHDHPCLGPRISTITPITGTLELVDDGSLNPTQGCNTLTGFTSGNIALIDRGTCAFEVKINNALSAGATAVLIADSDDFTDSTTEPDDVLNMACTDFCSETLITIPAVFVSYADGQSIHSELGTGTVTATVGTKDIGNKLTTSTKIWENGTTPEDTNQANNESSTQTTIWTQNVFADGFESGTTSAWSYAGKKIRVHHEGRDRGIQAR